GDGNPETGDERPGIFRRQSLCGADRLAAALEIALFARRLEKVLRGADDQEMGLQESRRPANHRLELRQPGTGGLHATFYSPLDPQQLGVVLVTDRQCGRALPK